MKFPCTSCGECCKRVGTLSGFPEPVTADGACSRLLPDNTCSIYETRPAVCRVDDAVTGDRREWHLANANICNSWVLEKRLPSKYLVVIP